MRAPAKKKAAARPKARVQRESPPRGKARTPQRSAAPARARAPSPAPGAIPASAESTPAPHPPLKAEVKRYLRAQLAALTGGLAPDDYLDAWWDWYLNVATHPRQQAQLARSAYEKILDSWQFFASAADGTPLRPGREDLGFADAAWNVWPFNVYARTYANWVSWWQQALAPTPAAAAADPKLVARELCREAAAGSRLACKFSLHQSRDPQPHRRRIGPESDPRAQELARGCAARGRRRTRPRHGEFRSRQGSGDHAGQGRVPQPPDRAAAVRAADADGVRGADPHHARLDHEVLHPRSVAAQLAGALPGGEGAHRIHDLVEEPGHRGSGPRHR